MDMFKEFLAKIEEIENANREMAAGSTSSPPKTFKPKSQKKNRQEKKATKQRSQERASSQAVHSSRRPVESQECPVEEWAGRQSASAPVAGRRFSLLENLGDHLDEAFMIQEILGPPMCMRDDS